MKLRIFAALLLSLLLTTTASGMTGIASAHSTKSITRTGTHHIAPALTNDSIMQLHNYLPDKKTYCLGIYQGHKGPGSSTIIWKCNGNADQNWQMQYEGTDNYGAYYRFQNMNSAPNAPQCLALLGSNTGEGASPIQWSCNNNTDQQWRYTDLVGGGFKLTNVSTSYCLGVDNGDVYSGAIPVLWACNGNPDQHWD